MAKQTPEIQIIPERLENLERGRDRVRQARVAAFGAAAKPCRKWRCSSSRWTTNDDQSVAGCVPGNIELRAGEPAQFCTVESTPCGEPQIGAFGQASHGGQTHLHQLKARSEGDHLARAARHNTPPAEQGTRLLPTSMELLSGSAGRNCAATTQPGAGW